jgi:nitrate reductase gamma subunit
MIDYWLALARGPIFRFAFIIMVLGLVRHVMLTWIGLARMAARTQNRKIPYRKVFQETLLWLFPFKNLKNRLWYSITSAIFHVGLIIVPVFLAAHILLWKQGVGISWPALSKAVADGMTISAILAGVALVIGRATHLQSRAISRFQDFFLPILLIVPFLSGYLASNPALNPFSYEVVMLTHVMSGNLILVLVPFTKLAHAVLVPTSQLVSEMAWHFPADAGVKVALALRKEVNQV